MKDIETAPGLSRFATNPLLLRIMAQIYWDGGSLPRQRVALYRQITEIVTRTWRAAQGVPAVSSLLNQSSLTRLLSNLAYRVHMEKPGGVADESEIWRALGKEWARITHRPWRKEDPEIEQEMRQFLQAVCEQTGILVEESPQRYGFVHLTFEEYYAACYLVANGQMRAQRIRAYLPDPRRQEPILLALGCIGMESPEQACALVKTAILARGKRAKAKGLHPGPCEPLPGQDYLFALRCLGENIPVNDAVTKQLSLLNNSCANSHSRRAGGDFGGIRTRSGKGLDR
jgi:hypothetical protein